MSLDRFQMRLAGVVAVTLLVVFAQFGAIPSVHAIGSWNVPITISDVGQTVDDPQIVTSGAQVVAAWREYDGAQYLVHTSSSSDGGATWSAPTRLSPAGRAASAPRLAVSGSTVIAVWAADNCCYGIIQTARSVDGGETWSSPVDLSVTGANALGPRVTISGTTAVAIWTRDRSVQTSYSSDGGASWSVPSLRSTYAAAYGIESNGNTTVAVWRSESGAEVRVAQSIDGGATWGASANVRTLGSAVDQIDLDMSGNDVIVVWRNTFLSNITIQGARSLDGGATWSSQIGLSAAGGAASQPSVSVSSGSAIVVWKRNNGSNDIAQMRHTADAGVTWAQPIDLSPTGVNADNPHASLMGSNAVGVWENQGSGIVVQSVVSTDSGATWGSVSNVSDEASAVYPQAVASDGNAAVIWASQTRRATRVASIPLSDPGLTWSPSASLQGSSGQATPSSLASSANGTVISYAVVNSGTSGCSVNASSGVVTYATFGTCQVQALVPQTAMYEQDAITANFVISAPPIAYVPPAASSSTATESAGGSGALQTITELRPAFGPLFGGNSIAIIGYGFTGATTVMIGGQPAVFRVVNDAHVEVVVPPGNALGSVDVAVNLTAERGRAFAGGGYVYTDGGTDTPLVEGEAPTIPRNTWEMLNPFEAREFPRGFVVSSRNAADVSDLRVMKKSASRLLRRAPVVALERGESTRFNLKGLPTETRVRVQVRIGLTYRNIGSATTSRDGVLTLPAISCSSRGRFPVRVRADNGVKSYINLKIT